MFDPYSELITEVFIQHFMFVFLLSPVYVCCNCTGWQPKNLRFLDSIYKMEGLSHYLHSKMLRRVERHNKDLMTEHIWEIARQGN